MTPYHAKFWAYELTRRCPADSVDRLTTALDDAQVDLKAKRVAEATLRVIESLASDTVNLPTAARLTDPAVQALGAGQTLQHDITLAAMFAERIVIMKEGKVLLSGGSQDVIHSPELRHAFDNRIDVYTLDSGRPVIVASKGDAKDESLLP